MQLPPSDVQSWQQFLVSKSFVSLCLICYYVVTTVTATVTFTGHCSISDRGDSSKFCPCRCHWCQWQKLSYSSCLSQWFFNALLSLSLLMCDDKHCLVTLYCLPLTLSLVTVTIVTVTVTLSLWLCHSDSDIDSDTVTVKMTVTQSQWQWQWHSHTVRQSQSQWHSHSDNDSDTVTQWHSHSDTVTVTVTLVTVFVTV